MASPCIQEGDYVYVCGGGVRRIVEVRRGLRVRLGRAGSALTHSLVGMHYGAVVELQHRSHCFVATSAYPDMDVSDAIAAMTRDNDGDGEENDDDDNKDSNDADDADDAASSSLRDNRALHDDNRSQRLSNVEVAAIRRDEGLGALLTRLREGSATFAQKTRFAQEKYLRKKATKYATLYKLERVFADNLAETAVPTIAPSDVNDTRNASSSSSSAAAAARGASSTTLALRADTLALLLHHGNVHARSRVLLYDKSNGVLPACLLARMDAHGRVYQVLDKPAQPNTHTAMRVMQLPQVKTRWRAVPRNDGLLTDTPATAAVDTAADANNNNDDNNNSCENNNNNDDRTAATPSQWLKGSEARALLRAQPADSLLIVDDDDPCGVLRDVFDLLALCGHVVVYSPYLCDLTDAFVWLRERCVNVRLSETWYRHHQVLPRRTHPTVHMSTAGGYVLTALKVEQRRPRGVRTHNEATSASSATAATTAATTMTRKRTQRSTSPNNGNDDDTYQQFLRSSGRRRDDYAKAKGAIVNKQTAKPAGAASTGL